MHMGHIVRYQFGETWGFEFCSCRRWARGAVYSEALVFPSPHWFGHVSAGLS